MSTRSRIGILREDGSILSAYHHYDGYPEWLGVTLNKYYNQPRKANKLVEGGDMSCCFTKSRWTKTGSRTNKFYGPQYYSKRGNPAHSHYHPVVSKNFKEYQELVAWEEFMYIYTEETWVAYKVDTKSGYSGFANDAPCTSLQLVTIPNEYPDPRMKGAS